MLKINDTIPNFEILTDNGEFKVSDHLGKKGCFFFPKPNSGCTAESIAFTILIKNLSNSIVLLLVFKDNKENKLSLEKHNLTCELGADFENNARTVWRILKIYVR